jgi:hypothetical protein
MKKLCARVAVLGSFAGLLLAADVRITLPPETAKLKEGPGASLAATQCLLCHSADYISTQPRLSTNQWKAAVIKMRDKYGAPIPEDKIVPLTEYLAGAYGNGR